MKKSKQILYNFLLVVGVLILVNILSNNYFLRLDLTADNQYTLSKVTKEILKSLKEPVTITVYFSEDVTPQLTQGQRDLKDLLIEYSNISKRKVVYEFINPENEDLERKAVQAGVQPTIAEVREKDQIKQQKIYVGAVIQMGERTEVIPILPIGSSMEYALSSSIKKLSITQKPVVGLLQGHKEPSLGGIYQAYSALNILYDVEPVYLNDSTYTLNRYKTLAIIAPKDSFKAYEISQIDRYLSEGGNIFLAVDRVDLNPQTGQGFAVGTGIENWLKTKGLTIDDNFVVDEKCQDVPVQIGQGMYQMLPLHYFPIINTFAEHTVTKGLDAASFQFASTVSFKGDSSKTFIPLVLTSAKSGTQPVPLYLDLNKQWGDSDFPLKNLTIGAALVSNKGKEGKIIVISDGSFCINGESDQQQQGRQLPAGHVNLAVNSIDWLSDDTGLIDLRSKGIKNRMLDASISDGTRAFLKYFNFLLPIILIVLYGVYRVNRTRSIRLKRMEGNYV
jgi:gliding-associated putative ABC transporter substrate-binding component GldG